MAKKKENRLVVANRGWAESIPKWLMQEVAWEREARGLADVLGKGDGERVGLAETCVYLCTEAFTHPLGHIRGQVYFWVTGKVMKKAGMEPPDFVKEVLEKGLGIDEKHELEELRRTLYTKRGGAITSPIFEVLKELKKRSLSK